MWIMLLWTGGRVSNDVQYRHAQALRHKTGHTFTVLLNTLTTAPAAV
jgi:hypothetical protein